VDTGASQEILALYDRPWPRLYFTPSEEGTALLLPQGALAQVQEEVARQEMLFTRSGVLAAEYTKAFSGTPVVERLIDDLPETGDLSTAFGQLVGMGSEIVPCLTLLLNDCRALHGVLLEVEWPESGNVRRVKYKPKTVSDFLTIVLTRVTGEFIGDTANGGSKREREMAARAWGVYTARLLEASRGQALGPSRPSGSGPS